jgi:hypothetical protein
MRGTRHSTFQPAHVVQTRPLPINVTMPQARARLVMAASWTGHGEPI